jgi:hypothetical protein
MSISGRMWARCAIALGLLNQAIVSAGPILADDGEYTADANVVTWSGDNGKVKVTVKDENGNGVSGKYVWVGYGRDGSDGWCIGPTGADGTKTVPLVRKGRNDHLNITKTYVQDPRAYGEDPHGRLSFDAATGGLSYTGGTMESVWYHDGSNTSTNGSGETIIGASVSLTGMQLAGYDEFGRPRFTDGELRIENSAGVFLSADYSDVVLYTYPDTGENMLWGTPGNFALNTGLGSRFISELGSDLASFWRPSFHLTSNSSFTDATSGFTTNGSIDVDACPLGGSASIPEPGTLGVAGLSLAALRFMVYRRRRSEPTTA